MALKRVFGTIAVTASLQANATALNPIANKNNIFSYLYEAKQNCEVLSFESFKAQFEKKYAKPITVGFDMDDTLVFSAPAFLIGKKNFQIEGGEFMRNPNFWFELGTELDKRHTKAKEIAKKLLAMHSARGDRIIVVTARIADQIALNDKFTKEARVRILKESAASFLNETFKKDLMTPFSPDNIFFTGSFDFKNGRPAFIDKNLVLQEEGAKAFYGDSDNDIEAAFAAGAEAVRILRSPASNNPDHYTRLGMIKSGSDRKEQILLSSEN